MVNKDENIDVCKIVQDLLPLYCDGQASDESVRFIKNHLESCEICKKIYEDMNMNFENINEAEDMSIECIDKDIDVFKKVKFRNRIKVLIGIITGIIICAMLFVVLFIGVIPANSEDIDINYDAYVTTKKNGTTTYNIDLNIELENGKVLLCRSDSELCDENSSGCNICLTLFSVLQTPFDNLGENPEQFDWGISLERPFTEDDILTIKYRDKTETISLMEIAEEMGIQ